MTAIVPLSAGEPAPWFSAATGGNLTNMIAFDELAGRYIVLFFFGTAARQDVAETIGLLQRRLDLFDQKRALLVGVSNDPGDFGPGRELPQDPRLLFLFDSTGMAAQRYGLTDAAKAVSATAIQPVAFILSPTLQILQVLPLVEPVGFSEQIVSLLSELLANPLKTPNAPVLIVPHVFDRSFCDQLVNLYEASGGREIGAIENKGKVLERFDLSFRKRRDYYISDEHALQRTKDLLGRRLLPMVYRAFQFPTTRIERYLVGCYDAQTGGYFRPHRDNTAPPVAHRRFALTINLNEDYKGGDLCFPEFGDQVFCTAPGDAIVFSCSLLHEVTPVTQGRRYAFISFLYDEQSQRLRDEYSKRAG